MRYWLIVLVAIAAFTITTFSQQPAPTPTQAQLRYLGLWDGQAIQNGVATDIALNFAFLQNGSFVGEILIKATKQNARFSSASVKPDGSIVFVLSVPNGPVRTHTGTLDASGQKMTGTYLHSLGAQSATGTFSATKRPAPQAAVSTATPMTQAERAQADAAADEVDTYLEDAQVAGLWNSLELDKALTAAYTCVGKFPRFARCYELRGKVYFERSKSDIPKTADTVEPSANYAQAIEDLSKAISLEPRASYLKYLYYTRGRIYLGVGSWTSKPDLAIADAQFALTIDPNYLLAKALLADAQKKIAPK